MGDLYHFEGLIFTDTIMPVVHGTIVLISWVLILQMVAYARKPRKVDPSKDFPLYDKPDDYRY